MAGTFLQRSRHGTVFYFRRRVPDDLRAIVGRPYIVKSLATEQRRDAIIRARALAAKTDALFNEWRSVAKDTDVIRTDFSLDYFTDEFGRERVRPTDIKPGEGIDAAIATAILQSSLDDKPLSPQMLSLVEAQQRAPAPITAERPFGMTFNDALEFYLLNKRAGVSSKNVYRTRLRPAQVYFGSDKDVRYIVKSDLREYATHTVASIQEVGTQIHNIRQLITFLNYLRDIQSWGEPLTTKNLIPTKESEGSEDRDPFTLEQLSVVFKFAKKFKQKTPAKYWITIATAFTGCRITELAQINLESDLNQDEESGVWSIDINKTKDSDGVLRKSLKNGSSKRKVPIHSALIKHGFLEYLRKQMDEGHTRPFENEWPAYLLKTSSAKGADPTIGAKEQYQWGRRPTNWGSYEMTKFRKGGLLYDPEEKLCYFHSMRHTLAKAMVNSGIPDDIRQAAIGHQYGSKDAMRYEKIKQDPVAMSKLAYEPGLVKIAELLDRLWEESSPEAAQGALQSI